jgi:CBS domain-containing protein
MTLRALAFGPSPTSLPSTTPVHEVLRHMLTQRINHVALRGADGRFAGLMGVHMLLNRIIPASARVEHGLDDLAFMGDGLPMLVAHFRDIALAPAVSMLTGPGTVLHADTPVMEAALMLTRSAGPLPVLDADGMLVGMLSARTLLAYLANEAEAG